MGPGGDGVRVANDPAARGVSELRPKPLACWGVRLARLAVAKQQKAKSFELRAAMGGRRPHWKI
jgi:hypothetical protein